MDARQRSRTLIVSALKSELLPIQTAVLNALPDCQDRLDYLVTGCGLQAARQSLSKYLSQTKFAQVVNFGTAGAIKSAVQLFDIVSPTSVMSELDARFVTLKLAQSRQFARFATQQGWCRGSLFSSTVPITSLAQKERLSSQTTVEIVDMEAFALLEACRQHHLPFYCIKIVTDHAQENSETEFQQNFAAALTRLSAAAIDLLKFILHNES